MTSTRIVITLLLVFFTASCNSPKKSFDKISLAIGGCNKTQMCPFISIEIDSNLNYKHFCFENCGNTGFFIGKILNTTKEQIDSKFKTINFKNIELEYEPYRDDEFIEMKIQCNEKNYKIKGHFNELPKEIQDVIIIVKNIHQSIELIKLTDSNEIHLEVPIPMDNYYLLPIAK